MVSHAHGQGYADLHFVIPETVDNIDFDKGSYFVDKGDFTTAGFVGFNTKNALQNSSLSFEGGQFDTFRTVALFNCKETDLVYRTAGKKPVLDIKNINMQRLLKKTVSGCQRWISEANTIGRDLKYHRGNENHLMALYVISEQLRYLFINASWILTGEWNGDGNIAGQQERIAMFNSVLGNTFDLKNKEEKEILRKLNLARKAVQRGEEIEPLTAEIVESAYEKMQWMMSEVKTIYQQYAEKTKQIFEEYGSK